MKNALFFSGGSENEINKLNILSNNVNIQKDNIAFNENIQKNNEDNLKIENKDNGQKGILISNEKEENKKIQGEYFDDINININTNNNEIKLEDKSINKENINKISQVNNKNMDNNQHTKNIKETKNQNTSKNYFSKKVLYKRNKTSREYKKNIESKENDTKVNGEEEKKEEEKIKNDIDTVKFELPVNLELKDEIKDVNLMQYLNYIEDNINSLLMINYTINLSSVINNNQQNQRNNMVDSNTISNKIEAENAINNENGILPNNQEINSLLGIGPQPPITCNDINAPILSDDFDIMQKSTVNKNALVVDKKNENYKDSYPMSREELMKANMNSNKK